MLPWRSSLALLLDFIDVAGSAIRTHVVCDASSSVHAFNPCTQYSNAVLADAAAASQQQPAAQQIGQVQALSSFSPLLPHHQYETCGGGFHVDDDGNVIRGDLFGVKGDATFTTCTSERFTAHDGP